jgi:hypothetical protein
MRTRSDMMRPRFLRPVIAAVAVVGLLASARTANAQAFTPGNLVVVRVGDGTTALSTAAAPVSLLEFTPTFVAQTPVTTTNFVTSGANAFTIRGNSGTAGMISLSGDGSTLYLPGFRADAGTALVENTASATVNRLVARIAPDRSIDTTTAITDIPSGGYRGAAGVGGSSDIYVTSENGGVRRVTAGVTGTSTIIANQGTTNLRAARVVDNQLFISTGSGAGNTASFARGLASFDPNLPTDSSATIKALVTQATGNASNQFILLDRSTSVPGFDTLYVADDASGQIDKYSFDGTVFTARGSATLTGVRGIAGRVNGAAADLFVTTAANLQGLSDTAAFDANIALGSATIIATAGTNNAFLGVDFVPVPEPTTVLAVAAGGLGLVRVARRRKRAVA